MLTGQLVDLFVPRVYFFHFAVWTAGSSFCFSSSFCLFASLRVLRAFSAQLSNWSADPSVYSPHSFCLTGWSAGPSDHSPLSFCPAHWLVSWSVCLFPALFRPNSLAGQLFRLSTPQPLSAGASVGVTSFQSRADLSSPDDRETPDMKNVSPKTIPVKKQTCLRIQFILLRSK